MRVREEGRMLHVELPGRMEEIPPLAIAVEDFCRSRGVGPQKSQKLVLALDELITNLAMHATHEGAVPEALVTVSHLEDRLVLTCEDSGAAFDPLSLPPPDLDLPMEARRPGGLGIYLIRELMDEASYVWTDGRNRLTLTLKLGTP